MKIRTWQFFLLAFLACFIVQVSLGQRTIIILDNDVWAEEMVFLERHDPQSYEFLGAYGHPGTIFMEVGTFLRHIFPLSPLLALHISISLLVSFAAAGIIVLSYKLHPRSWWWVLVGVITIGTQTNFSATPPSAVSSVWFVFFLFFGWWILVEQREKMRVYFSWGAILGILLATRLDAGLLASIMLLVLVRERKSLYKITLVGSAAAVVFYLANPFMWYMPAQHLGDLLYKFFLHHDLFSLHKESFLSLFRNSPLLVLAIIGLLLHAYRRDLSNLVMNRVAIMFLLITAAGLVVFFTSTYQAFRYIHPLFMLWEVLFPLIFFRQYLVRQNPTSLQLEKSAMIAVSSVIAVWTVWIFTNFLSH